MCFISCFPLRYVVLWDSKTPPDPPCGNLSSFMTPSRGRSPPLNLLSLLLSFIFCPTYLQSDWAAFLGAWCPLPVFRSFLMEVAQHSNDLLMNLWGRKRSPGPVPPSSWDLPQCASFQRIDLIFRVFHTVEKLWNRYTVSQSPLVPYPLLGSLWFIQSSCSFLEHSVLLASTKHCLRH